MMHGSLMLMFVLFHWQNHKDSSHICVCHHGTASCQWPLETNRTKRSHPFPLWLISGKMAVVAFFFWFHKILSVCNTWWKSWHLFFFIYNNTQIPHDRKLTLVCYDMPQGDLNGFWCNTVKRHIHLASGKIQLFRNMWGHFISDEHTAAGTIVPH